jgi:hypothetical protein
MEKLQEEVKWRNHKKKLYEDIRGFFPDAK